MVIVERGADNCEQTGDTDRDPQLPRCRGDESGDGLEAGVREGWAPEPEHPIDSCSLTSFMFTADATAAAIVGTFLLGEATSPWLQAAYFTG
ncbi:MAG: hypothetical protein ACYC65_06195 [Candidatus Limnocylindrales bacterium]